MGKRQGKALPSSAPHLQRPQCLHAASLVLAGRVLPPSKRLMMLSCIKMNGWGDASRVSCPWTRAAHLSAFPASDSGVIDSNTHFGLRVLRKRVKRNKGIRLTQRLVGFKSG